MMKPRLGLLSLYRVKATLLGKTGSAPLHHLLLSSVTIIYMLWCIGSVNALQPPSPEDFISEETQECLSCHETVTPGIVADWKRSRHYKTTPALALANDKLSRRISASHVPPSLAKVSVGCYECHSLRASQHKDNFEHESYHINVIVTPDDCKTCHPTEVDQYSHSKKAHAVDNLTQNPLYMTLVEESLGIPETLPAHGGITVKLHSSTAATRQNACFGCHGTEIKVKGLKTVETSMGEYEFPNLLNWPNQGVGRINPDGSRGACTACHPRHGFSIETARKPHTCAQCHLAPDVPAWNVYMESKHGNIYASEGSQWNWEAVPWKAGVDFKAPTCATCHNALIVDADGEVIAQRTHDFGSRLWVRIFGLIYSHPQPKDGTTWKIKNADDQPLPTTFSGVPASHRYLISSQEQTKRRQAMIQICNACHGTDWATSYFDRFELQIKDADQAVLAATKLIQFAWDKRLADPDNPFDEFLERLWVRQWLFYANSVRYAAAMSGPDYAAFKNGWWYLTENLRKLEFYLQDHHTR